MQLVVMGNICWSYRGAELTMAQYFFYRNEREGFATNATIGCGRSLLTEL